MENSHRNMELRKAHINVLWKKWKTFRPRIVKYIAIMYRGNGNHFLLLNILEGYVILEKVLLPAS